MQMSSEQPWHIVWVIENNAYESVSKYQGLYDHPEFECLYKAKSPVRIFMQGQ